MSQIRRTAADEPFFIVRSLAAQIAVGQIIERHAHPWNQLIYCAAGVMTVWTEGGSWVAPPHWAIWAPAGVAHGIRFAGDSALRTLYMRPDVATGMGEGCAAVSVSPLLRELVLRAAHLGMLDERRAADRAMALLIGGEIIRHDAAPFDLPAPASASTRAAAERLAAVGGAALGAAALARDLGLCGRTLERRFLAETGLTLAAWGRQTRLQEALRRLAAGDPVKTVAHAAGYRTSSAFVAAFGAAFGQTPGRYFASDPPVTGDDRRQQ